MRERLTKRNPDGSVGIKPLRYYNYDDFQAMAKKLADYEDAEEQGRIVVPPCKVGDKLHKIHIMYTPFISELKVENYGIPFKDVLGHWSIIPFEEIGKTVFLTREEAEKALKRKDEGK